MVNITIKKRAFTGISESYLHQRKATTKRNWPEFFTNQQYAKKKPMINMTGWIKDQLVILCTYITAQSSNKEHSWRRTAEPAWNCLVDI